MTVSGRRLPTTIAGPDGVQVRRWLPQAAQTLDELVLESVEHLHPWMPWAAEEPIGIAQRRAMLEQWEADWQAGGDVVTASSAAKCPSVVAGYIDGSDLALSRSATGFTHNTSSKALPRGRRAY